MRDLNKNMYLCAKKKRIEEGKGTDGKKWNRKRAWEYTQRRSVCPLQKIVYTIRSAIVIFHKPMNLVFNLSY